MRSHQTCSKAVSSPPSEGAASTLRKRAGHKACGSGASGEELRARLLPQRPRMKAKRWPDCDSGGGGSSGIPGDLQALSLQLIILYREDDGCGRRTGRGEGRVGEKGDSELHPGSREPRELLQAGLQPGLWEVSGGERMCGPKSVPRDPTHTPHLSSPSRQLVEPPNWSFSRPVPGGPCSPGVSQP